MTPLGKTGHEVDREFSVTTLGHTGAILSDIQQTSPSVLLPFAMEWDAAAVSSGFGDASGGSNKYEALTSSDAARLEASVEALANNYAAVDIYSKSETFDAAYAAAQNTGSPVGMIPHDDAMRYWMLSRTIIAGPEAINAYNGTEVSVQWCLPPLIRCTPPIPVPAD